MFRNMLLVCLCLVAASPAFAIEVERRAGPEAVVAPGAAGLGSEAGQSFPTPGQIDLGPGLDTPLASPELDRAAAAGDLAAVEREMTPLDRPARLARLEDELGRVRLAGVADHKDLGGPQTFWADFFEGSRHPLRAAIEERLGPAAEASDAPLVTKSSARLTAYRMDGGETRLHATDGILMSVHGTAHSSVDKTMRLLNESGRYKTPGELMAFIVGDVIAGYSDAIDSLAGDFRAISAKLDSKKTDDSVLQDTVDVGEKIDRMHETVQKQKRVLQELSALNEFHANPHVPTTSLRRALGALDRHLEVLDHYQDRKNGLIDLYRAKVSNNLDDAMKRLAALGILIAPYTIVAGFMGMNVAIPGSTIPGMFWLLFGGATAVSGAMLLWMKKKSWL